MALATSSSTPASMVSDLMVQGRESAAVLEALLQGAPSPPHGAALHDLAAQILRCCDRALVALHAGAADAAAAAASTKRKPASSGCGTAAPARVETRCTADDGFIWRKYGQKDIQNSKYPRLYFRCTYKFDSGCRATRQVQQSENNPSLYVITYFGEHTCCGGGAAAVEEDDGAVQPFVINFGSATASGGGGSPWLPSSDYDARSETSPSPQVVRLLDEESPAAAAEKEEPSSSANASSASPVSEPFPGCLDWDFIGDSSFDDIIELVSFDSETSLFQ